jgi:hypothetical protein
MTGVIGIEPRLVPSCSGRWARRRYRARCGGIPRPGGACSAGTSRLRGAGSGVPLLGGRLPRRVALGPGPLGVPHQSVCTRRLLVPRLHTRGHRLARGAGGSLLRVESRLSRLQPSGMPEGLRISLRARQRRAAALSPEARRRARGGSLEAHHLGSGARRDRRLDPGRARVARQRELHHRCSPHSRGLGRARGLVASVPGPGRSHPGPQRRNR